MRKLFYLAITFVICYILSLDRIWLGFVPVMLAMLLFRVDSSALWEIPLAVLSCSVLEIAFAEDIKILLYALILCGTVAVSAASPKRLFIFFPVAVFAIFFENIYAVAAVWATIWCGVRIILRYFTTKQFNLQEHKI